MAAGKDEGSFVRQEMRWAWAAAVGGILALGAAGWWIGNMGRSQEAEPASTAAPEEAALPAVMADLRKEWSSTSNPNPQAAGTWTYMEGGRPLSAIASWASGPVAGWGPSANVNGDFLPFMFQATSDGGAGNSLGTDFKTGDIIVHSWDTSNGGRRGEASIVWKSAVRGMATIDGRLWPIRSIDRTNTFQLVLHAEAGTQTLATGTVAEDASVSRENPVTFTRTCAVHKGDTVELLIVRGSNSVGDFAGVGLSISTVPERGGSMPGTAPAGAAAAPVARPTEGTVSYGAAALVVAMAALVLAALALGGVMVLLVRQRRSGRG